MSTEIKLTHPSIMTVEPLKTQLNRLKTAGKRVVFTNGCFDVLHPGHVDLLARAKSEGDVLVVGLNTDVSVKRQNKAPDRPINSESVRAFMLAHLASVDYVVFFPEDTPLELIRALEPDVLVKGGDWNKDSIVGADLVESRGGRVLSLSLLGDFSSTAWLGKIKK
jgi:rfaE bifunctional protein nucleotidyltransferase chain/domain